MPEISVIIPVHNRREDLRRCLIAIATQDFPKELFEVIICDDGSDEDLTFVSEFDVTYLRQEQMGPGAARNLGIREARGRYIAMTDSDTIPARSWLRKLYEAFENNPDGIGVEGRVCADNEGAFSPLGEGPFNKQGGVYLTCNCAYKREILYQVGGFDESFPYPAYEDIELAARVRELGAIIWQPDAVVIHPERLLTLKSVLAKLNHWEYVTIIGYRYGYLGWEQYPVNHPALRASILSVVALPLSKWKCAARWFIRKPIGAIKLALYGIVESIGAIFIVVPRLLFGITRRKIFRGNYLFP